VHTYFTITEYYYPLIPGRLEYIIMSSSLTGLGIAIASTVEYFSRRFVKKILLTKDGKQIIFTFHSAFSVNFI
jgi:hypothetical protein